MSPHHQFRRGAALCIALAVASDLSLDQRFETATVSEKLSLIRERVGDLSKDPGSRGAAVNEARVCYAGYWRNC
jgi:hypothetical protein